jgi:hypothetical protein
MNELQHLYEKYKSRDIIEIKESIAIKIIEWAAGSALTKSMGQSNILPQLRRLTELGFIKFLNKAVIFLERQSPFKYFGCYPFEFTHNGTLLQSIYITDPDNNDIALLCKVEVGTDIIFHTIEGTFNDNLAKRHIDNEMATSRVSFSSITDIITEIREHHQDVLSGKVKVPSEAFFKLVAEHYLSVVIKAQIYTCVSINAYLVLTDKELLITKNRQLRIFKASDKREALRHKRNPLYRYKVNLPDDYVPRKFNLNYILDHWERSGHKRKIWVRKENVEVIKAKHDGQVVESKGDYVAILIPIKPKTLYRRCASTTGEVGVKSYET